MDGIDAFIKTASESCLLLSLGRTQEEDGHLHIRKQVPFLRYPHSRTTLSISHPEYGVLLEPEQMKAHINEVLGRV